ncbi:guanine nucleotide-exchange factor SEC12 isoform 2-T2 [Sylvia borin]
MWGFGDWTLSWDPPVPVLGAMGSFGDWTLSWKPQCLSWVPWGALGTGHCPGTPSACPGCHGELWGLDAVLGPLAAPSACPGCHGELWGLDTVLGPPVPVLGAMGSSGDWTLSWNPWQPPVAHLGAVGRVVDQGPAWSPHGSVSRPAGGGDKDKGVRRRRGPGGAAQGSPPSRAREVRVESLQRVRTDFSPDALQKAVRFSNDGALLATGGADGFLRLWEFPSMKKTLEFKAHDGEIEDIALGPDNKVVTAGRDFQCCVWQQDQLVTGLRWHENLPGIPDKAYRYQACRFGAVEDNAGALRLYTVQVPHKRERRPPPCYLTKWDGKSFLPLLTRPCGSEVVSCLSISDSGTFLGLGTVTGSVAIHIAFSLQRLYYVKEAHGIVVTDVAFVPESRPGRELLGGHEAALLSVAVDSRCKVHLLPARRSLPVWLLLLLCAGLIVATILLLQLAFPGFL